MRDTSDLIGYVKQIANEAVESGKPTGVFFGKVKSTSPLVVTVDQKLELGEKQLILSSLVKDFTVPTTFKWSTEVADAHTHGVISNETRTITLHFRLRVGEKVILLRLQGGQKFLILDRVR